MRIAFRVDASSEIGSGHLFRCLVLADVLVTGGAKCLFILRNRNMVNERILHNSHHTVTYLANDSDLTLEGDALATLEALRGGVDWLVVDHYELDAVWELSMQLVAKSILVIDDLANRSHYCQILTDPGLGRIAANYQPLLQAPTDLLLGTRYAILRPAFAAAHGQSLRWPALRTVQVFLGGGQATKWLAKIVSALLSADKTVKVIALGFADEATMKPLLECYGERLEWHLYAADMTKEYLRCDIAVGSPGSPTWERACIGIPSGLIATAKNQIPILEQLEAAGFCKYFGAAWDLSEDQLREKFVNFANNIFALEKMRESGITAVDGCGAQRIADRLLFGSYRYA